MNRLDGLQFDWELLLLGNEPMRWLIAAGVATATFFTLQLLRRFVGTRLRRFAARTATEIDDTLSGLVDRTNSWALFALALIVGSRSLSLPDRVHQATLRVAGILLIIQVAIWASFALQDLVLRAVRRREKEGELPRSVTTLIAVGGSILVWSTAFLIAVETLGYDATALVTGLGIGGVAIGLALQGILKDLFGFLAIVLDRPFAVDDTIAIGDLVGKVERIGIKTTRLRALSGEEMVFGNHDLLSSRVRNFHDVEQRRIVIRLGVVYDTPPGTLAQIPSWVQEAVESVDSTEFQRCFLVGLAESSIEFELVLTVETSDYNFFLATQQGSILAILRRFEQEGVDLAFPTRTLVMNSPHGKEATA